MTLGQSEIGARRSRVRRPAGRVDLGKAWSAACPYCLRDFFCDAGPEHDLYRTRGHLRPKRQTTNFGPPEIHSPFLPRGAVTRRLWVWQCRRCNQDQGNLNMRQWHLHLRATFDPRTERVGIVIETLYKRGYREHQF